MTKHFERTTKCDCGSEFHQKGIAFGKSSNTIWSPRSCEACENKEKEAAARVGEEKNKRDHELVWEKVCPPLYRDTDPDKLPPAFLRAVDSWTFNPKGIALIGERGKGKTRSIFRLLRHQHDSGIRVMAISAIQLAKASFDQFEDDKERRAQARDSLALAYKVPVLFIDDLGKQKFTERAELDLFDILETRTANLLPTHWTANATSKELGAMLSPERGAPLLRRLVEFSEIIKL